MKINSIDISTFNSKLCERVIGLATINIASVWENQFLEPINYIGEYKFKPIKLVFDVKCSNNTELEIMKSKLYASFFYYFYFARNCEAGSCV